MDCQPDPASRSENNCIQNKGLVVVPVAGTLYLHPAHLIEGRALPVRGLLRDRFLGGGPAAESGAHPLSRFDVSVAERYCAMAAAGRRPG